MLLIWHSAYHFCDVCDHGEHSISRFVDVPAWRCKAEAELQSAIASLFRFRPGCTPPWVDYPCHSYIWLLVYHLSAENFQDSALVFGISFPKFPHHRRLGGCGYNPTSASMENSNFVVPGFNKLGQLASLFCLHMCCSGKHTRCRNTDRVCDMGKQLHLMYIWCVVDDTVI